MTNTILVGSRKYNCHNVLSDYDYIIHKDDYDLEIVDASKHYDTSVYGPHLVAITIVGNENYFIYDDFSVMEKFHKVNQMMIGELPAINDKAIRIDKWRKALLFVGITDVFVPYIGADSYKLKVLEGAKNLMDESGLSLDEVIGMVRSR